MSKKIEEITDKIEANKEVLSTMPKNNIKNMDIYQKKLEELEEEFKKYTPILSLSDTFYTDNICYTYEEYLEHLSDTKKYMKNSKNYKILFSKTNTFRNINITIHSNKWVMVSKNMHPAIQY